MWQPFLLNNTRLLPLPKPTPLSSSLHLFIYFFHPPLLYPIFFLAYIFSEMTFHLSCIHPHMACYALPHTPLPPVHPYILTISLLTFVHALIPEAHSHILSIFRLLSLHPDSRFVMCNLNACGFPLQQDLWFNQVIGRSGERDENNTGNNREWW